MYFGQYDFWSEMNNKIWQHQLGWVHKHSHSVLEHCLSLLQSFQKDNEIYQIDIEEVVEQNKIQHCVDKSDNYGWSREYSTRPPLQNLTGSTQKQVLHTGSNQMEP